MVHAFSSFHSRLIIFHNNMVLTVACLQSKRHSSPQNMWNQHSVFFINCFCCPLSWISTKLKRRHRGDGCLIVKKHSHSIQFCHNCFEHFSPFLNCSCPFFVAALLPHFHYQCLSSSLIPLSPLLPCCLSSVLQIYWVFAWQSKVLAAPKGAVTGAHPATDLHWEGVKGTT